MRKFMWNSRFAVALAALSLLTVATAGSAAAALRRTAKPTPTPTAVAAETPEATNQTWLGVELQDVEADMAKALDLPAGEGALLSQVVENSPAEAAGLKDGDVVIRFDGKRIRDAGALSKAVRAADPGDKAEVVVVRDGREKSFTVELGKRPAANREAQDFDVLVSPQPGLERMLRLRRGAGGPNGAMTWEFPEEPSAYLGILMGDLTEQLGRYFGLENGEGVLVQEVVDDSPAAAAGLEAGDVIVSADGHQVKAPEDVRRALRKAQPGDEMELAVVRERNERTFTVKLAEPRENAHTRIMRRLHGGEDPGDLDLPGQPGDDEGGGDRKVIIRRLGPGGDPESMQQLRDEIRELRGEIDRLREEMEHNR